MARFIIDFNTLYLPYSPNSSDSPAEHKRKLEEIIKKREEWKNVIKNLLASGHDVVIASTLDEDVAEEYLSDFIKLSEDDIANIKIQKTTADYSFSDEEDEQTQESESHSVPPIYYEETSFDPFQPIDALSIETMSLAELLKIKSMDPDEFLKIKTIDPAGLLKTKTTTPAELAKNKTIKNHEELLKNMEDINLPNLLEKIKLLIHHKALDDSVLLKIRKMDLAKLIEAKLSDSYFAPDDLFPSLSLEELIKIKMADPAYLLEMAPVDLNYLLETETMDPTKLPQEEPIDPEALSEFKRIKSGNLLKKIDAMDPQELIRIRTMETGELLRIKSRAVKPPEIKLSQSTSRATHGLVKRALKTNKKETVLVGTSHFSEKMKKANRDLTTAYSITPEFEGYPDIIMTKAELERVREQNEGSVSDHETALSLELKQAEPSTQPKRATSETTPHATLPLPASSEELKRIAEELKRTMPASRVKPPTSEEANSTAKPDSKTSATTTSLLRQMQGAGETQTSSAHEEPSPSAPTTPSTFSFSQEVQINIRRISNAANKLIEMVDKRKKEANLDPATQEILDYYLEPYRQLAKLEFALMSANAREAMLPFLSEFKDTTLEIPDPEKPGQTKILTVDQFHKIPHEQLLELFNNHMTKLLENYEHCEQFLAKHLGFQMGDQYGKEVYLPSMKTVLSVSEGVFYTHALNTGSDQIKKNITDYCREKAFKKYKDQRIDEINNQLLLSTPKEGETVPVSQRRARLALLFERGKLLKIKNYDALKETIKTDYSKLGPIAAFLHLFSSTSLEKMAQQIDKDVYAATKNAEKALATTVSKTTKTYRRK